MYLLLI